MPDSMTERERLIESLTFGRPDHLPFEHSYGLMPGTLERWRAEGLPPEVTVEGTYGDEKLKAHFGFTPRRPGLPVNFGLSPAFEPATLEETDDLLVTRDNLGVVRKLKKGVTSLALPVDFPIQKPEDFADYKRRLQFDEQRFGEGWLARCEEMRRNGWPISAGWMGFYWFPRDLMGDEGLCVAYYERPELLHDFLRTYADLLYAVSERLLEKVHVDVMHMGEDMCYRNGMMISPSTYREFILPHYQRLIRLYRDHGTRVFSVDTDGNVAELLPLLIEAGVNVCLPMEVRAGNDIVAYRRQYRQHMAFSRGLNKLALMDRPVSLVPGTEERDLSPREAIDLELDYRLKPMVESGGYIAGLDHRVVPETSLDSFTYYVRRVREMLGMDLDAPAFR